MTNNPYKKVAYIASFGTVILDDPDPSFDPYDGYDEYEYYHYNEFGYDETMAALENLAYEAEDNADLFDDLCSFSYSVVDIVSRLAVELDELCLRRDEE